MILDNIQTTTGVESTPESQEYIDSMSNKADAGTYSTEDTPLFAGKYKTVAEMEQGYLELQKKLGAGTTPEATAPPATQTATPPDNNLTIPETPTAPDTGGMDISGYEAEFIEKGELSKESYEALAKAGIPQTMVDSYIAGQQLIVERKTGEVFAAAGGQAEYTKVTNWAQTALSVEERNAFNEIIQSGDIAKMTMATRGLRSAYENAKGSQPSLLSGTMSPTSSTDVFNSKAEMTTAMADKRYAKDPAYRQSVIEKLGRSSIM